MERARGDEPVRTVTVYVQPGDADVVSRAQDLARLQGVSFSRLVMDALRPAVEPWAATVDEFRALREQIRE